MKILKLAAALLMTVWVSSAHATLIFDFNFTDVDGNTVISGEILGLVDDATSSATAINYFIRPSEWRAEFEGVMETNANIVVNRNRFIVEKGELISGGITLTQFQLRYQFLISRFILRVEGDNGVERVELVDRFRLNGGDVDVDILIEDYAAMSITRRVIVPEPTTFILMSLGIAGLSFSRYRRRS